MLEADDTKQADMQIIEPIEPNLVQEAGDLRGTSEARGQPEISANVKPIEDATMVEPTTDEDHTLDSPIPEIATSPLDTSQQGGALPVETKADDPDPSPETGSHYGRRFLLCNVQLLIFKSHLSRSRECPFPRA